MRRRGKRELAALLAVALLAGSAACGADAGEKDAATGTAEAAAGQDTETAAGQGTDAQAGAQENLEETALSLMREVNPAEAAGTDDLYRSWYEVFVYSFYDGDGDGIGDLPGLTEKLDYINDGNPATDTDLGCDGIWLMPVMPATTYHKYDVTDYCAIDEQYGTMEDFETSVDLNVDAYIPDSYISNEFQKLDIYKRIAGIETQQDYDDMLEELLDRFGEPGKAVLNLLAIAKLKAIAHQGYVTEIKQTGKTVRFTLYEKARLNTEGFPALMQKYRRGLQFKNEQEPKFILEPQGNLILALTEFAEELKSMAENM